MQAAECWRCVPRSQSLLEVLLVLGDDRSIQCCRFDRRRRGRHKSCLIFIVLGALFLRGKQPSIGFYSQPQCVDHPVSLCFVYSVTLLRKHHDQHAHNFLHFYWMMINRSALHWLCLSIGFRFGLDWLCYGKLWSFCHNVNFFSAQVLSLVAFCFDVLSWVAFCLRRWSSSRNCLLSRLQITLVPVDGKY